jgi:hypothetical protein
MIKVNLIGHVLRKTSQGQVRLYARTAPIKAKGVGRGNNRWRPDKTRLGRYMKDGRFVAADAMPATSKAIQQGARGGQFFVNDQGKKIYLRGTKAYKKR